MKRIFLCLLTVIAIIPSVSAVIYRHDVPEEQYRILAAQPWFDCVGKIIDPEMHHDAGSCVLIGSRYVLTAAHVMVKSDIRNDTIMHGNQLIIVYTPVNTRLADPVKYYFRFNNRRYKGKAMKILPAYFEKATRGQCDIALIELDEPVENVTPARLCAKYDELGSLVTGVGYGASGKANKPEEVDIYGTKLAGQNMIDSVGGYLYEGKPALLIFDFDHPEQKKYNLMGSAEPVALEYLCGGGDSGGGMFRPVKDGWELIGICSGSGTDIDLLMKIGYYGNTGKYTRVSLFDSWIRQSIRELEKNEK